MTLFLGYLIAVLLATILIGLWRVLRPARPAERLLAAQLFGTAAVAILMVLSRLMEMPALLDVALVFALLAIVTIVAFVVLTRRRVG
ncbi:MAG: monovalent cation/H+ antiporter complex subunit F [Paracoccus sp. (in: a-proteobacteria)]|nr:monovalent cation/H+ antiporter complex subunit F [Paracoccus sp. (in: a-proteobacteria)]